MADWVERVIGSEPGFEGELVERYTRRLLELARRQLPERVRRRVDPEDVVQSVYRSFFQRLKEGRFAFDDSGDLWRLLAAMTFQKAREAGKFHKRKRRDVRRDRSLEVARAADTLVDAALAEPGPEDLAMLVECLELMVNRLPAKYRDIAVHPGGRRAFVGSSDGLVQVWNIQARERLSEWQAYATPITDVTLSRDGERLATASRDGMLKIWRAATGELERMFHPDTGWVYRVAWIRDGSVLAAAGKTGTVLLRPTGEPIAWLTERHQEEGALAFGPVLVAVPAANGTIELRSVEAGDVVHILAGHTGNVRALEFSPDGRQLASASADKTVRLWDVDTGREAGRLDIIATNAWWLSFHPSGKYLVVAGYREPPRSSLESVPRIRRHRHVLVTDRAWPFR